MLLKNVAPMTAPRLVDCHTHSRFSVDSSAEPEQICACAVKTGLRGVCITDHLDHCPSDAGFGYYRPQRYFEEINRIRERYSGRLQVLTGVEFGNPHRFPRQFEEYTKLPYDIVIGSVHFWYKDMRVEDLPQSVPFEAAMEEYFLAVEASLNFGGFDVLGHLGFPKKYYEREMTDYDKDIVDEILLIAIKNSIVPEINTSPLTQGMGEPSPNFSMTERYIAKGGRRITLGSDAHTAANVASNFDRVWERYHGRLQFGFFENRHFQSLEKCSVI